MPQDPNSRGGRLVETITRACGNFVRERAPNLHPGYSEYVEPVLNEAVNRVMPDAPPTIIDLCDRLGILPAKPAVKKGLPNVR